jgi:hypothetical protein
MTVAGHAPPSEGSIGPRPMSNNPLHFQQLTCDGGGLSTQHRKLANILLVWLEKDSCNLIQRSSLTTEAAPYSPATEPIQNQVSG